MSLRSIAGGAHFSSYNKCAIFSLIQFLGIALIAKYTLQYWSQTNIYSLLFFCVLTALYIIYRYVPRDTENKRITDCLKRSKFKRLSLYYILIWVILMIIFSFFDIKIIVVSSCFGLLLELFSCSKLGRFVYDKLDQ